METADTRLYRWRFADAEFDEARMELRVNGLAMDIGQRPLQVLAVLLRRAGDVVTKQELFGTVWAGRVTVDHVLATAIGKLRKALGAQGETLIVTVPRVGYRLDARVERGVAGRRAQSPLQLRAGQPVPGLGRENFRLERQLDASRRNEVWLARHAKTREARVFKFGGDDACLSVLRHEATLSRLLRQSLGEREDFVRLLDWNFERPPFFLEYEYGGADLREWAAAQADFAQWPLPRRLAMFLRVADAVADAHGAGVLHKDIKPANVLVVDGDGEPRVRLTDFGSGRLLEPERLLELGITDPATALARTASGGTPLYLAPELIAGESPSVRSDIYALGVLLYQFSIGDFGKPIAPGWEHDIGDALLREDIADATDGNPARRLASVAELARRLRGLDARHGERERRRHEAERMQRLQHRLERTRARRPWVIAAGAVLALGLLGVGLLWKHSERQRYIAQQQAARAEAVVRFLDHALGTISTGNSGHGNDATIREMLEYASAPGNGYRADDPKVRGDIHALLGRSWRNLGDSARGAAEYREAVRGHAQALGASHEQTLRTRYALVRTLAYMQTAQAFAEAGRVLDETDRLAGARLRQDSALALQAALERGIFHLRRLQTEPALHALRRADRLQREIAPDDAGVAALIRGNIADALRRAGHAEQTLAWLHAARADPLLAPERIGEVGAALLRSVLAEALHDMGRDAEALPLAQAAAETSGRFLGSDNYLTLVQLSTVAGLHAAMGNCAAALPLARDARERLVRQFGQAMQAVLIATGHLGKIELDCGDDEAGLAYLRDAEQRLRTEFGEDNTAARAFAAILAEKAASPVALR
ncbi:MAG: winged helix-turn-helix domain-containing protein [Xenophilus sp.]